MAFTRKLVSETRGALQIFYNVTKIITMTCVLFDFYNTQVKDNDVYVSPSQLPALPLI